MRAIQMTPAFHFQKACEPRWMAHTPVGHDILGHWLCRIWTQSQPRRSSRLALFVPV